VSVWINGRKGRAIDQRDRGFQYGDGVFETMRVRCRRVRLLDYHLDRLYEGCARLKIRAPLKRALRGELERSAALRADAVLKLIVTRGIGPRGYRPSGTERCTRVMSLHPPALTTAPQAATVRVCRTRLGMNPDLAGLKTLNRLESVLARGEWRDARVWEGLMRDVDGNLICGTMSNFFIRRGSFLLTPMLDRCGVAGVMRRWVLEQAGRLSLRALEGRLRWEELGAAEEVFMTNAVAGIVPVAVIQHGDDRIELEHTETARRLREHLELL
jgi:4-amino-4-deoxychorismate lyase